ncbi:hypothetical protein D3C76_1646940 [compost metagenome]
MFKHLLHSQSQHHVVRTRLDGYPNISMTQPMHIEFDLNQNDLEALLRHCQSHTPSTGDKREDHRLEEALELLEQALVAANAPP